MCDVVYTPVETDFVKRARAGGVDILSGHELFLYQGIHAFKHFTGYDVDASAIRRELGPAFVDRPGTVSDTKV